MAILKDLLLVCCLLTALLVVRTFDRLNPATDFPALRATPPTSAAGATDAPMLPDGTGASTVPSGDAGPAPDDQLVDGQGTQPRTGIIDSFEPYPTKLIDEPPPSPPKLVDTPPPAPPKLVEIEEPPPPPAPEPEPPPVKFFETETRAKSVGYVVDCSSSMSGEKFQAVCMKLADSILTLKRDQEFFVVFFNDQFFPMTGSAVPKLVQADSKNKRAILGFLRSAQASGGTNPEPALQFMTTLRPDIIYLLTDGEFSPLNDATYRGFGDAGIVVHTLGFETGGRVAILEEIARRTSGTYQPAARGASASSLLFAPEQTVRAALKGADPALRRDAARAAVLRGLQLQIQLIEMLRDSDSDLRETILDELREAAGGSDFGPADAADTEAAIRRWKLWRILREAPRQRLMTTLAGNDPDGRWVAAAVARATELDAPDELIAAMRKPPSNARAELRAALVYCSGGEDFGPELGATDAEAMAAADRWQAWRDAVIAREAASRREKKIRRAADLLTQAKNLIGINDEAVERRYRELVDEFGDTPAGEEARVLLKAMARPTPEGNPAP
jgi:hypothetical protein